MQVGRRHSALELGAAARARVTTASMVNAAPPLTAVVETGLLSRATP